MTANLLLQKTPYPGITSDNFGGSACTKANKSTGRELFVANGTSQIFVDRRMLKPTADFTELSGTVTFNIPIDDRHKITVFR